MMSDVENAEKCNLPNSPSEPTIKPDSKEISIESPENTNTDAADPTISEDGKLFVCMDGELDFEEVLSPEKTEKLEEQTFPQPNEVDSKISKTGEPEKTGGEESSPQKGNESKAHAQGMEEGEDDGECSDDEDLEEGEVKDENETVTKARSVCRFFNRGTCFYGASCRFLHLGNYNMFSPNPRAYEPAHMGNMMVPPGQPHGIIHRSAPRSGPDFMPVPPLLPAPVEHQESAWEKGLREAKELLKKASQRKEEPDFEEKRLTLSLANTDRNQINEREENGKFFGRTEKREKNREELYKYGDPAYNRTHRYENFEIRYMNVDRGIRPRRRAHGDRRFNQREDNPGHWRNGDRMEDMERIRGEAYFDPWRRSKSPKHRRSKDRERSRSPFGGSPLSSVSSYSSRSSSYSRSSSSLSRGLSSRSPSPAMSEKKNPAKNKSLYPLSPPKEAMNKLNAVKGKKKPGGAKKRNSRARSYSRSRSRQVFSRSRTFSSSRSRSISRGPRSAYSSRSSRSLSMDSVSSASSSVSHSSSAESSGRPEHVSILRRQDEKPVEKEKPEVLPAAGFYFQIPRPIKSENIKETDIGIPDNDRDPLDESFQMSLPDTSTSPSLQQLIPTERERAKDPVKGLHPPKQQIKLTLLNKNPQSKLSNLPKKELELIKTEEAPKVAGFLHNVKRPLSPPVPPAVMKPQPAVPKKSASSRRDELLKQLKAVEDAIARKRAKFC